MIDESQQASKIVFIKLKMSNSVLEATLKERPTPTISASVEPRETMKPRQTADYSLVR